MIDDRVTRGMIAGAIGAVLQNVYIYLARAVGLTKFDYADYAQVFIFLKINKGMFADFIGLIGHFTWDVLLAVIFAYMIKLTSSKFYILKGMVYGIAIWFFIKVVISLFRLPVFSSPPPQAAFVFLIGAILYGFVIGYVLKLLDARETKI